MTELLKDPRVLRGHTFLSIEMLSSNEWEETLPGIIRLGISLSLIWKSIRSMLPVPSSSIFISFDQRVADCRSHLQNCQGRREEAKVLLSPGFRDK